MKKVIFLLVCLNSLLFSEFNPATDKIVIEHDDPGYCRNTAIPINTYYIISDIYFEYYYNRYKAGWNDCASSGQEVGYRYSRKTGYIVEDFQCPSGQEIINGACAVPPTCTAPQIWNSDTDTCVAPPAPDADGDGTPDKCDFDHPDFNNLDCDDNGIPNGTDPDIDGDGTENRNDADANKDGKPDATDPSSPTYNSNCQGADVSGDLFAIGKVYELSTYSYKGTMLPSTCNALVDNLKIDSSFSAPDLNPNCSTRYCYAHHTDDECNYWASDFIPEGGDWIITSIKSESACTSAVDGTIYLSSSWAFPSPYHCSMDKWCYLKQSGDVNALPDDGTDPENGEDEEEPNTSSDTNSTSNNSLDITPIVESINVTNSKLEKTNEKLDNVNLNLTDLKTTAVDSKNILDKIAKNSLVSNSNESESLNRLANINTSITGVKNTLSSFSDVATANQVVANGHLDDISGKMSTNNDLLSEIKDSIDGDGSSPDTSAFDGFDSALSDYTAYLDSVQSQYSFFSDNVSSSFLEIETQYNNALSLFENPLSAPALSGSYNASCFSFNVFGKHVVLDMSVLSAISPVIYFITTLGFMLLNFRFLLNHLLRGND